MRVLPRGKSAQIMFYQSRLANWAQEAEALGLDPQQIAIMEAKVEAARLAFNAQRQAMSAARARTQALHNALDAMNTHGASLIRQVRARTATIGSKAYVLAQIPAPDKPSPIGPPGKPDRITVELSEIGGIVLRWTCKNPRGSRGTAYHVHRRIAATGGQWEFLGIAGRKKYVDATVPAGVGVVSYRIQAFRSTALGPVAEHHVNLGGVPKGLPIPGRMQLATRRPEQMQRAA